MREWWNERGCGEDRKWTGWGQCAVVIEWRWRCTRGLMTEGRQDEEAKMTGEMGCSRGSTPSASILPRAAARVTLQSKIFPAGFPGPLASSGLIQGVQKAVFWQRAVYWLAGELPMAGSQV